MKKLFLAIVFLFCMGMTFAQEIKPSEQAQGVVNFKNTSVDYSTGTFRYQIPLFELTSGNYKLPVVLSYTANGIKSNDFPGLYGYGWNLICGGVVTRTLRGGMVDEKYHTGYVYESFTEINDSIREKVNQHHKDGESDIFTAVFNGQRIDFILEAGETYGTVRAVPLEKTNVKIGNSTMEEIPEWRITDENGVIYVFGEKERTSGVAIEEAVSQNSVTGESYISTWYLTEIIVPHAPAIRFSYANGYCSPDEEPNKAYKVTYYKNTEIAYEYGRPMREHAFDMKPYEKQLQECFELVKFYAKASQLELQVMETRVLMDKIRNTKDSYLRCGLLQSSLGPTLQFLDKCVGLITELEQITTSSDEIIRVLNSCINSLSGSTSTNMQMLRSCLMEIKGIYKNVLTDMKNVTFRESGSARKYNIYPKRLTGIICGDQDVVLEYRDYGTRKSLVNINLYSSSRDTVVAVKFGQDYSNVLTDITIKGSPGSETRKQTFTYYSRIGYDTGTDAWGYYNGSENRGLTDYGGRYPFIHMPSVHSTGMEQELKIDFRDGSCHEEHLKRYSLKTITNSAGSEITVDYERNWLLWGRENCDYSGLRVKDLVIRDGLGGVDSVHYHYVDETGKSTGRLIVTGLHNGYTLNYGSVRNEDISSSGFRDLVVTEHVEDDGMKILVAGNNGVMYRYVREERVGNGSTGYYFCIPSNTPRYNVLPSEYSYWMYGLPLGKVDYDKEGRIVSMQKNRYYASTTPSLSMSDVPAGFVYTSGEPFPFSSYKPQLKPFGFYMDETSMKEDYQHRPNIPLFTDGLSYWSINPYRDIYLPNLGPRMNLQIPDQSYRLYHGGKVVLKEQEQYVFDYTPETTPAGVPRYVDLTGALPSVSYHSTKKTYQYGNAHVYPVRETIEKSDGDRLDKYMRRVADVTSPSNAHPEAAGMKTANMLAPVLQQQAYVTRGNASYLLAEKVIEYASNTLSGKTAFLPVNSYDLRLEAPLAVTALPSVTPTGNLFTKEKSGYTRTGYVYDKIAGAFQVKEIQETKGNKVIVRDKGNGRVILETASFLPASAIAARDKYRTLGLTSQQIRLIRQGLNLPFINAYDSVNGMLNHFLDQIEKLERNNAVRRDPFIGDALFYSVKTFSKGLLMRVSYDYLSEYRDTISNYLPVLESEYALFWRRVKNDVTDVDERDFMQILYHIKQYVMKLNGGNYRYLDFKENEDYTGFNLSDKLLVTVDIPRVYNLSLVTRKVSITAENIRCKVVYRDGTSHAFTKPLAVESNEWRVVMVKIDLSGLPTPTNIVSLEVNLPGYAGSYRDKAYGTALAVLAPAGVDYEAVSRDRHGRVFCKLNHLGQVERHDYDGLGRVIRSYDARGNVLVEREYHEAE